MPTSTPLVQKASTSISSTHVYDSGFNHHHRTHHHQDASLPRQPQAQPHTQDSRATPFQELSMVSPPLSNSSDSPPPQQQKSSPVQLYFQPKEYNSESSPQNLPQNIPSKTQELARPPEEEKVMMRLDLRKIGCTFNDGYVPRKRLSRESSKRKSGTSIGTDATHTNVIQTTLNAGSWSAPKAVPVIASGTTPAPNATEPPNHLYRTVETIPWSTVDRSDITSAQEEMTTEHQSNGAMTENVALKRLSASLEPRHKVMSDDTRGSTSDGDDDYVSTSSQAAKRQSTSTSSPDPGSKKRTRNSNQGTAKKKKVQEETRKRLQAPVIKKQKSVQQVTAKEVVSLKDAMVATAADGGTVDNSPPPAPAGIFRQLLDNVNRANPKSFALPTDIQTFFKGVIANSDGEYEDKQDYKPRPKRTNNPSGTSAAEFDSTLELQDNHGDIRLCYRCNKSAMGGRFMISCDHCPLHWHLDCLSPPMASAPPNTRKWMCPNHAEHVLPRRRKRKDAVSMQVDDPKARNDGYIEVIPDPYSMSLWDGDTSGVQFRVPERTIKQSFIEKCQRVRQSIAEASVRQSAPPERQRLESSAWQFNLLVAAAMASEQTSESDVSVEPAQDNNQREKVQDAVLERLTDPAEREEYQRFRSFQRYLREHGAEDALKQWICQQEQHEQERIASQGLLNL
ncbi:hypothetical protein BG011_005765 [Mortierella polycephala]|uniref:PHD-type domain-containing protein n=1 Tax=Mortierella polycephala TaxID=41804 RepID=A0A9P6U0I2_9FUNG|nr:hypothetical protein BG011_005765 [Mortierella polycephala]